MRASVADRAGNVTEAFVDLPEGTGSPPDLAAAPPGFDDPPPISQISNGGGSDITAGPGFTPVTESPPSSRGLASRPAAAKPRFARVHRAPMPAADQGRPRRTRTATRVQREPDA